MALGTVVVLSLACGSGEAPPAATPEPEVVVVPVPEDDRKKDQGPHWCCEFETAEGSKQYALVDGAAQCTSEYGDRKGAWVENAACTPCCCKSPNDAADLTKGYGYELSTAHACSATGECLAENAVECGGTGEPHRRRRGSGAGGGGGTETDPDPTRPSPVPSRPPTPIPRPGLEPKPSTGSGGGGSGGGRR
jgi:hypothetical protein